MSMSAKCRFVALAIWCHCCGAAVALGSDASMRGSVTLAGMGCSIAGNDAAIGRAQALFKEQFERRLPQEISTHHAVIVAPTDPLEAGGGFAAEAYLSLPRAVVDGNYTLSFTKFVVVGHSRREGVKAVSLGADVCGHGSALLDVMAANFFRSEVIPRMGCFAPTVVSCDAPSKPCGERVAPGLERQLPILSALLGAYRTLNGSVLPIMMQGQDLTMAVRLGEALAYLVQPGGIWAAERVLFVFAGDLSEGLPAAQESGCDNRMVEVITQRGVAQAAEYIDDLLAGRARGGCPGPAAVPRGYGPIIAAARVAAQAKLLRRRAVVTNSAATGTAAQSAGNAGSGQGTLGFMSALFWNDERSVWERLGARAQQPQAKLLLPAVHRHFRQPGPV